jgi:hypothetical protein
MAMRGLWASREILDQYDPRLVNLHVERALKQGGRLGERSWLLAGLS